MTDSKKDEAQGSAEGVRQGIDARAKDHIEPQIQLYANPEPDINCSLNLNTGPAQLQPYIHCNLDQPSSNPTQTLTQPQP